MKKFVINRIKDINRQIGTGYYPAIIRLIKRQTEKELLDELKQHNYVTDEKAITEHVNKRAREINQRLSVHWYKQLPPFDHCEPINNNIHTANCETIND